MDGYGIKSIDFPYKCLIKTENGPALFYTLPETSKDEIPSSWLSKEPRPAVVGTIVPPIYETELEIPDWGVEIETNTGANMENPFRYDNLTGYDKVVALQYHRLADFLIKFASEDPAKVAALELLKSSYVNLVNND